MINIIKRYFKNTALKSLHERHKATFRESNGYMMPYTYSNLENEYKSMYDRAVLFDEGNLLQFEISGADRVDFINVLTTSLLTKEV